MVILFDLLKILGALALFIYGMRVMSEALQKASGMKLRQNLAMMTQNRIRALLAGTIITAAIQSSSATTILIVSFVNAGLLTLTESLGLVLGANIGTTITAWLVTVFGFKLSLGSFALPLIAIGFPLYFSAKHTIKYSGTFIIGFALIFIALDFIKSVFPEVQENAQFFEFVLMLSGKGFLSLLFFLFFGMLLTAIIQSSSVAWTLTLIMCMKGWISFDQAAAMVLGENIGTTITANIAALVANRSAKRSALFHTLVNVIGLFWALPLLIPALKGIESILIKITGHTPFENVQSIPIGLALFHSMFNISNAFILFWLVPQSEHVLKKLIKIKNNEEAFGLKHFMPSYLSVSEFYMVQLWEKVDKYGIHCLTMYNRMFALYKEVNEEKFYGYYDEIKSLNEQHEELSENISKYISGFTEEGLSKESYDNLRVVSILVYKLDNIGESVMKLSKIMRRKRKNRVWFTQDLRNNLNTMFDLLQKALFEMENNLGNRFSGINIEAAKTIEKEIDKHRKKLQKEYIKSSDNVDYKYEAGVLYSDMVNRCERLGDSIFIVSRTLDQLNDH